MIFNRRFSSSSMSRQRGTSLLEALVSLLILAVGVLGMLGMQVGVLAETQNSTSRAQALRIIEDLSERMKGNPNAYESLSSYALGSWDIPAAPTSCASNCNAAVQAAWDIYEWRSNVPIAMPGAQAYTFISSSEDAVAAGNQRMLGVMMAWRLNEREENTADSRFDVPFDITDDADDVECPDGMICHIAFIQP